MKNYFADNLKNMRKNYGYTQEEFAEKINVSFQTISKWERGESCPDILTLPLIARVFNVSVDELLSVNKLDDEKKIAEYIEEYNFQMRLGKSDECLSIMKKAVNEFPSEHSLQIRYMEAIMRIKNTDKESAYSIFNEVNSIYESIMKRCIDDEIRIWAKRLICILYRRLEKYDDMIEIIDHLPRMGDCKEQVRSFLLHDGEKHDKACKYAIEEHVLYLFLSICQNNYYLSKHSIKDRIHAAEIAEQLLNLVYCEQDYGRAYNFIINNYAHLGEWYFLIGDENKALENFKKCAELAVKYTEMPDETVHTSFLVKDLSFNKVKNENIRKDQTIKARIYKGLISQYKLSDEFRNSPKFKNIVEIVKD